MNKKRLMELAGIQLNEEDEAVEMKKSKDRYTKQVSQFRKALATNKQQARQLAIDFDWETDQIQDELYDWFLF